MKKYLLHFLFLIIVVGDLTGELLQLKWLDYSFKPFILIWIGGYFLMHASNIDKKVLKLAVFAFLFSWFGDILLMFGEIDFIYFMVGLVSFLIAQIFYISLFLRTINLSGKMPFLKKKPVWLIAYIAFGLIVYTLLYSNLDSVLRVAVFVYMVALLGMSAMALNRFGNGHPISFRYIFIGSILFVLSDTIIALNKFMAPIPYEGIFIMTTYIGAQYLIMRGLLKQYQ
ncbi:MAG: lysoplasmalogenase [Draconibacterium sp.]|nr:lysoplasmalogenase [Draconibacterium sp.]